MKTRRLGLLPSPEDKRDYGPAQMKAFTAANKVALPDSFTWGNGKFKESVLDQGDTSWCVLYSGATTASLCEWPVQRRDVDFDPKDIVIRKAIAAMEGVTPELANGCCLRDYLKCSTQVGLPLVSNGFRVKTQAYARLHTTEQAMRALVATGPLQIGISVYDDLYELDSRHYTVDKWGGSNIGRHAMCVYGWTRNGGVLRWQVQNSWGPEWGLRGTFLLGEKLVFKELGECWTMIEGSQLVAAKGRA